MPKEIIVKLPENISFEELGRVRTTSAIEDRVEELEKKQGQINENTRAINRLFTAQYEMKDQISNLFYRIERIEKDIKTINNIKKGERAEVTMLGRPVVNVRTGKRVKRGDLEDKVWYMDLKNIKKRRVK